MVVAVGGRLIRLYTQALRNAPLRTQITTTASLWALGDALSQRFERRQPYDYKRTGATALYGGSFIGPIGHWWYQRLDRVAARYFVPGRLPFISFKVVADTAFFGPLHIVCFFSYMIWMEGGGAKAVRDKLGRDFWPTMGVEVAFWPAFQALNFWRVPVDYHLLMVNAATIFESAFMCWARSQDDWWAVLRGMVRDKQAEAAAKRQQRRQQADRSGE